MAVDAVVGGLRAIAVAAESLGGVRAVAVSVDLWQSTRTLWREGSEPSPSALMINLWPSTLLRKPEGL